MQRPAGQPLDLGELVEALRAAGFRIDTRQYLSAHELLLACAARGVALADDAGALRSGLGPIFCTTPEEQQRFPEVLDRLLAAEPAGAPTEAPAEATARRGFWRRALLPALAALLVAAGLGTGLWMWSRPVRFQGTVVVDEGGTERAEGTASVRLGEQAVEVAPDGTFELALTRRGGAQPLLVERGGYVPVRLMVDPDSPGRLRLVLRRPPKAGGAASGARLRLGEPRVVAVQARSQTSRPRIPWGWVGLGALAVALIMVLLWASLEGLRRVLVLTRLPATDDVERAGLGGDDVPAPSPEPRRLRSVAAALRRPVEQAAMELDVLRSAEEAARWGGLAQPVYRARLGMPEYAVLIERRSPGDHLARVVEDLLAPLEDRGVRLDLYHYDADPRTCYAPEPVGGATGPAAGIAHRRALRLGQVLALHPAAGVLVFGDPGAFLDPLGRALAPWVEPLRQVPRLAVFTPSPPHRWGHREWRLLELGLPVLPASLGGLELFADVLDDRRRTERLFPAPYARPFPALLGAAPSRWLDREPPEPETLLRLLGELRGYLGPPGFTWLAACAVYPDLEWPLTLYLGAGLPDLAESPGGLDEALRGLARLPWFRLGWMPEWLRRALIAQLTPAEDRAIRGRLLERLDRLTRRALGGDGAGPAASWIHALASPVDLTRAAPRGSPLADAVFVAFVDGRRVDPTTARAPRELRRLFRRPIAALPGSRSLLGRWALPAAATAAVAALSGLLLADQLGRRTVALPRLSSAAAGPGGRAVVLAWDNLEVDLVDVAAGTARAWRDGGPVREQVEVLFGSSERQIALSALESTLVSEDGGASLRRLPDAGHAIQFSGDGRYLLTARAGRSGPPTYQVWGLGRPAGILDEKPTASFQSQGEFAGLEGSDVLVVTRQGKISGMRPAGAVNFPALGPLPAPIRSGLVGGGNRLIAAWLENGEVRLWSLGTAGDSFSPVDLPVRRADDGIALSADGRVLAVGQRGQVLVLDTGAGVRAPSGQLATARIAPAPSGKTTLALAPDGSALVQAVETGDAWVWPITIEVPPCQADPVQFLPQGTSLPPEAMVSLQALARCLEANPGFGLVISDRAKGSYGNLVAKALMGMGAGRTRVSLGSLEPCREPSPASARQQAVPARPDAASTPDQAGVDCGAVNRRVELELVRLKASQAPAPPSDLRLGPKGY